MLNKVGKSLFYMLAVVIISMTTLSLNGLADELPPELLDNLLKENTEGYIGEYVKDYLNLLDEETLLYIETKNTKRREGRTHVYVETIEGSTESLYGKAQDIFVNNQLSTSDILLVVVPDGTGTQGMGYCIVQGDDIREVITDAVLTEVLKAELEKPYHKGEYSIGIKGATKRLFKLTKKIDLNYVATTSIGKTNNPAVGGEGIAMSFVVAGVFLLILLFSLVASAKEKRKNKQDFF